MTRSDGFRETAGVPLVRAWRRSFGAMVVAAGCIAGPHLAAGATTVGSWAMNEPAGSTQMIDSVAPGHHSDLVVGVTMSGAKYTFPGWTANIDPAGQLVGDLVDPSLGEIRVPDPAGDLIPRLGSFSVKVKLKPTLLGGSLPIPGVGSELQLPSYNIVQRGRSGDPGGFFKLELMGYGPRLGKVHCAMKAPGFASLDLYSASIINGASHKIECVLDRQTKTIKMYTNGVLSDSRSFVVYGSIEPRDIYGTYLTVGKKPGSDNPADAFAGQIDYVTLSR